MKYFVTKPTIFYKKLDYTKNPGTEDRSDNNK